MTNAHTPRHDAAPAMLSEDLLEVALAPSGCPACDSDRAWLRKHIDAQAATIARLEGEAARLRRYEGHLKKLTILRQRDAYSLETDDASDEVITEMLEGFWVSDVGSEWLDQLEAAKQRTAAQPAPGSEDGAS